MAGEMTIALQEAAGLDVYAVLLCLLMIALGVLVGDRHGKLVEQFLDREVDWRGVGKLGKDDQPNGREWGVAQNGPVGHGQHLVYLAVNTVSVAGVGHVGLASGGVVAKVCRRGHSLPRQMGAPSDTS